MIIYKDDGCFEMINPLPSDKPSASLVQTNYEYSYTQRLTRYTFLGFHVKGKRTFDKVTLPAGNDLLRFNSKILFATVFIRFKSCKINFNEKWSSVELSRRNGTTPQQSYPGVQQK